MHTATNAHPAVTQGVSLPLCQALLRQGSLGWASSHYAAALGVGLCPPGVALISLGLCVGRLPLNLSGDGALTQKQHPCMSYSLLMCMCREFVTLMGLHVSTPARFAGCALLCFHDCMLHSSLAAVEAHHVSLVGPSEPLLTSCV